MKDKNILIVSCVFPPEPVVSATISFDLANSLSRNNKVTVLSPKPTRPLGYIFEIDNENLNDNFNHIVLNSFTSPKSKVFTRFYESYSLGKHAVAYIKENKNTLDIVYLNSWPLASQYLIVKACKKWNIDTVVHVQDIYPETLVNKLPIFKSLFYNLLLPFDRYILKNARTVVTISSGMKTELLTSRNLENDKVKVVYNWQSTKGAISETTKNKKFTFLFLGTLSTSAQIESVIIPFANLKNANCQLIIAGSGSDEPRLKKIAQDYPSADINFIRAASEEVSQIQSNADILVLSLREGVGKIALPSKLVSYMYSKKPVLAIVEKGCDIEKIIEDSKGGWVVRQNNFEEIKNRMFQLSQLDKEVLKQKGQNALNFAAEHLSRDINLTKLTSIVLDD